MYLLELSLMIVLLGTCIYTSITDIKSSVISNKILLLSLSIGLLLNMMYYAVFARAYLISYIINFSILSIISILFYAFHLWAAGDSKLLILITFLLPARLFGWEDSSGFPAVSILVFAFACAFIYVVVDAIIEGIRKRNLFQIGKLRSNMLRFVKSYIFCGTYLSIFNQMLVLLFPLIYVKNAELFMLASFFVALIISQINWLKNPVIFLLGFSGTIGLSFFMIGQRKMTISLEPFILLLVIVFVRLLVEKYNYQEIPTEDVKTGMILSFSTVVLLNYARVFPVPITATEDMRSKLSEDAAEKVREWGRLKRGQKKVLIVRRIPFAIFISAGTLLFIFLRVGLK